LRIYLPSLNMPLYLLLLLTPEMEVFPFMELLYRSLGPSPLPFAVYSFGLSLVYNSSSLGTLLSQPELTRFSMISKNALEVLARFCYYRRRASFESEALVDRHAFYYGGLYGPLGVPFFSVRSAPSCVFSRRIVSYPARFPMCSSLFLNVLFF